jgi:nanoRNase/pAp phosphatase (c-di-AMP/oligoRNAs hydrolase)
VAAFGGGGHRRAAGAEVRGALGQVEGEVLAEARRLIEAAG